MSRLKSVAWLRAASSGLALAALLVGCAPAGTVAPSPGAPTADAGAPPIGASWKLRTTNAKTGSVQESTWTAVAVSYGGKPAYGMTDGSQVSVFNPTTFNHIARLRDGKEEAISTPDSGLNSWPLWTGKTWTSSSKFQDALRLRSWDPIVTTSRVTAYEDVTVPAGTFKAFRIERTPGLNNALTQTHWYAPAVNLYVKSISERSPTHYLGAEQTTTELISVPK